MKNSYSFHPAIQNWFDANFSESSPPQKQGWHSIANSAHTLILAPTGSGKTLAAFLWCIDDLFRKGLNTNTDQFSKNPDGVHTLYISPLKALNYDIHRNLEEPLKGIRKAARTLNIQSPEIRALVRTGDTPSHVRTSMVKKPPHILITTPESLYLLITSERGREIFKNLQYLIVDEIHSVCSSKRGVHLSLSLERLMTLCKKEPVRIGLSATQKPLEKIAAFLGGQNFVKKTEQFVQRPVTIVDCGRRKSIDLKVISPVDDFSDLPESSVWPEVYQKVYRMILAHKTTLVFVNMRSQTEKIARELNKIHQQNTDNQTAEIALAHHGSISREARFKVEQRLKEGKIPAVVATASLELGIDIGSIELVVQLESPRSITSALQRVGRSGHLLHATSKGRIIPLYPGDLDDSISIAQAMLKGEIEESSIPENCLDVLAQHIVAEVSLQEWGKEDLFHLVRQSYCYRNLTHKSFENVLEMLSGKFANEPLRNLQPRLTWDRVNHRLIPRSGARLQAVMNSGTIPDRGYYGVYLAGKNIKLGDMEEEFVFESKVGDTFYLGNNEWRITDIKNDRIIVSSGNSAQPRAPFWKGNLLFRDYSTQSQVARFREDYLQDQKKHEQSFLHELNKFVEPKVLLNVENYFHRQIQHNGKIATDQQIVVEYFRDVSKEPHVVIHAPFGARVNGIWAIALNAVLEEKYKVQIQYDYDDDAILLRFFDFLEFPDVREILKLPKEMIENYIINSLAETPYFSIYFRFNATRALLLQRSRKGIRIPLWMQRLRSADLLQMVRKYPDFPIVIETYRECLQDVFDLNRLKQIIDEIRNGGISVHHIQTPSPSPMTSGVLFQFLSKSMYDYDQARYPSLAANVSSELLAEILETKNIPTIVTENIASEAESNWQLLSERSKAKNMEDLFSTIEKLEPIETNELQKRTEYDFEKWLLQLKKEKRIKYHSGHFQGWISADDSPIFENELFNNEILTKDIFENSTVKNKNKILQQIITKYLFPRGPVSQKQIIEDLKISDELLIPVLQKLRNQREVVSGKLVIGTKEEQWCNRQNFAELYRHAVAKRRETEEPLSFSDFYRFSLLWHQVGKTNTTLEDIVQQYKGYKFPIYFFEREILRTRFSIQNSMEMESIIDELRRLVHQGEIFVLACKSEENRVSLEFIPRGEGAVFFSKKELLEKKKSVSEKSQVVFQFLQENGASFLKDISSGTGFSYNQVENSISELIKLGLLTCDNYSSFLSFLQETSQQKPSRTFESSVTGIPSGRFRSRARPSGNIIKQKVLDQRQKEEGRWFLTSSFAVMGKEFLDGDSDRITAQTNLLLNRYGILIKDWYRKEKDLLPWYPIFQMLKKLEWQGEIRRGYFVDGLSGLQFSLPQALGFVKKSKDNIESGSSGMVLISTMDPVLPFGGAIDWNLVDKHNQKIKVTRLLSNHLIFVNEKPVIYSENYGLRLWLLRGFEEIYMTDIVHGLKIWLKLPNHLRPKKRIEIKTIDFSPAGGSFVAKYFLQNGFEKEGNKLVLWHSGV